MPRRRAGGRPKQIAQLLQRVDNNPRGLHYALRVDPVLRGEIEAYFASGGDAMLNDLLARAFPRSTASAPTSSERATEVEKAPKDATLALPASRADNKPLAKGVMTWKLQAVDHSDARVDVDFLPDKDKVEAKNVSFAQTVLNTLGGTPIYAGASVGDVGKKSLYSPYEEAKDKRRVDHSAGAENDPFYGAEWGAKEATTAGASEPKNRRVQIWVK